MEQDRLAPLLKRGVIDIITEPELRRLLASGRPLRLKYGLDPSRPDIHLGHVVGLRKLRQFQELGHQVILIVGDWTAQIGDPSGVAATRPMLSAEEVRANAETYMRQFFKVVDRDRTQVKWQSEWFGRFDLAAVIKLTSKFTVAQMLAREDFSKRYSAGQPIAITEFLYPLLQAYDSIMVEADVEFGGSDQRFNCLVGRELQQMVGQKPQQVFLMPLLVGTDGSHKMSKSLNNYVAVDEPPHQMFGKVMSIPDNLMLQYFELLTDLPQAELEDCARQLESGAINPMLLKKRLAREIVAQFHGAGLAADAELAFAAVFQKKQAPEEMTEFPITGEVLSPEASEAVKGKEGQADAAGSHPEQYLVSLPLLLVKAGLANSRGEARRLIAQGAVDIDGATVTGLDCSITPGSVVKVGKRRFLKLVRGDR